MVTGAEMDPATPLESATATVKIMKLRYDGRCGCGQALPAGTRAGWDRATRIAICQSCLTVGSQAAAPGEPVPADVPTESASTAPPPSPVQIGVAGASLDREYQRRVAKREQDVRKRHPRIGRVILALTDDPQTTKAFRSGAEGERRAAARITERCGTRVLFLLNRQLGKGRRDGDIDMIAITAGGVHVIDVKRYQDATVEVRRSGGLFRQVSEQLYIGGRDRTHLLESLAKQRDAVRLALAGHPGGDDVRVTPILCFVDANLPLLGTPRIAGVPLLGAKGTAKLLLADHGPLDDHGRTAVQEHLARLLPPAA